MTTAIAELLDIPEDAYHRDELGLDEPSLSKSVIQILLTKSPAHARAAHPKMNRDRVRVDEKKFAVGNAAHSLFLEGVDRIVEVAENDWKKKAAQEARDAAYAAGLLPLLTKDAARVREMAAAIRPQLDLVDTSPALFTDGRPERTMVFRYRGVLIRCRLDWLRDDLEACDDLKTTSASAAPEKWSRTMFGIGGDLQAALYGIGLREMTGREVAWRYVVQETEPPYALTVFSVAPDVIALATRKLDFAIDTWRRCLETGVWPAYPSRVCWVTTPPWEEAQFADREYRDEEAA